MRRETVVVVAGLLLILAAAARAAETSRTVSDQAIAAWTAQLNGDTYEIRDAATRELIKAGLAAVAPVCQAIQNGHWEVVTRGTYVLQELSLARELETEQAALAALERISAATGTAQARRAAEALSKLDHLRRQRAVEIFTRLGATINAEHQEKDMVAAPICALEIGPEWRGEETDLRRLKWLSDVQQVTFSGERVRDSWVHQLRGMENLLILKIKRAPITDAAFEGLKDIPSLSGVKLLYLPIGDPAAAHLSQCPRLKRLKLIGTNVSPVGQRQLAAAFGAESVDCRRGAFLGITPSVPGESWYITAVSEQSAAEQAGLIPGDVIVKYGDQRVPDFEALTRLISQNNVGDTVQIEVLRDGKVLPKTITFGEWE
jgi:hypothetical protein